MPKRPSGGDGGDGGAAALAHFSGSGQIQAAAPGVLAESVGGNGGAGASVSTSDALVTNYGGNGGNGGQGGAAVFTWQGGSIQANRRGGIAASYGGVSSNGGSARSGDQNYGGNGGLGGSAGSAGGSGGALISVAAGGLHMGGALAYEHSALRDHADSARISGDSLLGAVGLRYQSGALVLVGSIDSGYA